MDLALPKRLWWEYISEDLRELLMESQSLITKVDDWEEKFHDYAFVVFPAAKAFEGFLKKLFLDKGFISQEQYLGKRFRIGKALNPSLETQIRQSEGVYDKLVDYCGGPGLADSLWTTWKEARNLTFHWFPEEKNAITFKEAVNKVKMLTDAMDATYSECKIK